MKKITLLFICFFSVLNIFAKVYSGSCGSNARYSLDTSTGVLSITGTGAMTNYSDNAPWYSYKSYIKKVIISDGITSIGTQAFYNCSSMTSVTIPNSVKSIGNSTFCNCSDLTSVTIPNSVTSIERYAFEGCTSLISVTIPNKLKSIGYNVFENCKSLTSVIIPNSVTSIGIYAFAGCKGLTSVIIPNNVTIIEYNAFYGCSGLKSVTMSSSVTEIGSKAFYGCTGLTSVHITDLAAWCKINFNDVSSNPLYYAHHLFMDGKERTDLIIPNGVKSINDRAFNGCYCMTSITIPSSVTSIGESAFAECYFEKQNFINNSSLDESVNSYWNATIVDSKQNGLAITDGILLKYCGNPNSVTIPNNVTSINDKAFNAQPIKTIWLTNTPPQGYKYAQGTVNYVANSQYSGLSNLKEYKFLSSMFEVDGVRYVPVSPSERTCDVIDCIYDDSVTEVSINPTVSYKSVNMKVQNVQPYTFYQNLYLKTVRFDIEGSIGKHVLFGCNNLQNVVFGQNVIGIGEYAFNGCSKLESITIPESVDTIGQYAFSDCAEMKSVVIGNGTKTIGQYAFSNCTGLTTMNIGEGASSIGSFSFSGCSSLSDVNIGNGPNSIGNDAFSGCSSLVSICLGEGTITIGYNAFSNCSILPTIIIPNSVNSIGNDAFSGCSGLKAVMLNDREKEGELKLGYNGFNNPLFADCPLDSVYIGRNISYNTSSSYGYSPFYRNTTLRSVTITDKETEISENEFYGCTNLQNVLIGDGVTSIGNWAFSGCSSLKNFSFGTQVKTIGQEAFSDCTAVTAITSKAENPPVCGSMALDDINKWECKLYVPEGHVADYQAAVQWKEFFFVEEGEEGSSTPVDPSGNKCATPTIEYVDGKLTFDCETDGVEFVYNIVPQSSLSGKGEDVNLPSEYRVTVYAIKGGYEDSDVATKEINISGLGGIRGDVNFDNEVGMPDVMFIVNYILNGKFPDEE